MSTWGLDGWLVGKTSADLRACYLDWRFRPLARAVLRDRPEAQSLTVAFSQYWCDEADDAVHESFRISAEADPPWASDADGFAKLRDDDSLRACDCARALGLPVDCDDNASLIVAFLSCCAEGSAGDWDYPTPTPWAIARRDPSSGEPAIEVIGRVRRPEWEDRWQVGFQRGAMRTLALDAHLAADEARRERLLLARPSPRAMLRAVLGLADALYLRPGADSREPPPALRARLRYLLAMADRLRDELEADE